MGIFVKVGKVVGYTTKKSVKLSIPKASKKPKAPKRPKKR